MTNYAIIGNSTYTDDGDDSRPGAVARGEALPPPNGRHAAPQSAPDAHFQPPTWRALPGRIREEQRQWISLPALLVLALLLAIALPCVVVGADTIAHHVWPTFTARAAALHRPAPSRKPVARPAPTYDTAGYLAALHSPVAAAYKSELANLHYDLVTANFAAAGMNAPGLVADAKAWLNLLGTTDPPPSYRPGKLATEGAVTAGLTAGKTMVKGLHTLNTALFKRALAQVNHAQEVLP